MDIAKFHGVGKKTVERLHEMEKIIYHGSDHIILKPEYGKGNFSNDYGTGAVALLMLIAKVWDGINDPMMGTLMERTHTKWIRAKRCVLQQ